MKKFLFLICMLFCGMIAQAEITAPTFKHEFRLGWGDPILDLIGQTYETDAWGSPYKQSAASMGHIFVEYMYNINSLVGVGFQFDFFPMWYKQSYTDYKDGSRWINMPNNYANFSFMPMLRLSYYHNDLVTLYSSLGVGFKESNTPNGPKGYPVKEFAEWEEKHHRLNNLGMSINVTAIGVSVGRNHWYGSFELGALLGAFSDEELCTPSRVLSASVGYRF